MCPDIPVFSLTQTQVPSVIVWVDESGIAHARDAKTGNIIAEGSDHASVIQAALDAAAPAGGRVFIGRGTYDLGGKQLSIAGKSNISIRGEGMGATVIYRGAIVKNDRAPTYNVEIADLTIDGGAAVPKCVNLAAYSYNFRLKRVELKNSGDSFLLFWEGVDNLIVEDSIFYDGGLTQAADNAAGTQLYETEGRTVFRNCLFVKQRSKGGGLLTTGGTGNLLIDGCTFIDLSGNAYAAISIENSFGPVKDVTIVNCRAYGKSAGIRVGNSTANPVEKAVIANCIATGLVGAINAKEVVIANCVVFNTGYGFYVSDSKRVAIANCVAKNTNYYNESPDYDKIGLWISNNAVVRVSGLLVYDDQATPTTPRGIGGYNNQYVYLEGVALDGPFKLDALSFDPRYTGTLLVFKDSRVNGGVGLGSWTRKIVEHVDGYATRASGVATIPANSTSVTVGHGLALAPSKVLVTPTGNLGAVWVENITSTSFTIRCSTAPAADTAVYWYAEV